jgi:L-ascorbate metabolism protein UlaG (beta-lactamase superfamily)
VVELENARRIYFAGDTDVFGDMALIAELHHPDVAFLPIGGHYTMDPRGAAKAAQLLGVRTVVPMHYGTFPILAGTPDQLRAELGPRGLGNVQIIAPQPGETVG